MNVHLLARDAHAGPRLELSDDVDALLDDIGLRAVIDAMAAGDRRIEDVVGRTLLTGLTDTGDIRYRQDVLRDAIGAPALVRDLYRRATEAVTSDERRTYAGFGTSAATTLAGAVHVMEFLVGSLRGLHDITTQHAADVSSEGLRQLFTTVGQQIDEPYLDEVGDHLRRLRFPDGVRVHARLGRGLRIVEPTLTPPPARRRLLARIPTTLAGSTLKVPPDEEQSQLLDSLRDRSLQRVAHTLAEATEQVTAFFDDLRTQLAFYVGCLNLLDALALHDEPVCFPEFADTPVFRAHGLYDAGLCLRTGGRVVGNDVDTDGAALVMVTGANQGGKSTFLRSVGMSQLMAQSGMFAPARSLQLDVRGQLFTHFTTGEDRTLHRGQLDDELARMSGIVDRLRPGSVVLLNESFAATTDREGSQIAAEILRALMDAGVRVFFVTHLLEVSDVLGAAHAERTLFLRAERRPDGRRTFRVVEGAPLSTSYAADLYDAIVAADTD